MRKCIAAAVFAMIGCGSDPAKQLGAGGDSGGGDEVVEAQQDDDVFYIQAGAELPPCDRENKLIYFQAESTFKICAAGAWANIDLRGPAGTDNRIVKSISCSGGLGETIWNAQYSVALMASGDLFASANISDGLHTSSGTNFFSSQQVGAASGGVAVVFDGIGKANYGFWTIMLNRETLVATVAYVDSDYAGGGTSWTMTPDKCTVNDYTTPPATALTSSAD